MCRLIIGFGNIKADDLLTAALNMSTGRTANHDGPITCHPNGWGMVWHDPESDSRLSTFKNEQALEQTMHLAPKITDSKMIAVHVRHATLSKNVGPAFCHPVTSERNPVPWYLMHNGFLPTIYEKLNLDRSYFDSREYYDYVVPTSGDQLDGNDVLNKLSAINEGGTSANALLINPQNAYVIHWSQPSCPYKSYFQLYRVDTEDAWYISSEPQPHLAPLEQWRPLEQSEVFAFDLKELTHDRRQVCTI